MFVNGPVFKRNRIFIDKGRFTFLPVAIRFEFYRC